MHVQYTKWMGSQYCDLCGNVLNTPTIHDAPIRGVGTWAIMCSPCYIQFGKGGTEFKLKDGEYRHEKEIKEEMHETAQFLCDNLGISEEEAYYMMEDYIC